MWKEDLYKRLVLLDSLDKIYFDALLLHYLDFLKREETRQVH